MDCNKLKDHSIRLNNSVKSSVRVGQPDKKACHSSNGLSSAANMTNPIMCAICGSKEYITLHSDDKNKCHSEHNRGWDSPDFLKKNLAMEFPQSCGPLSSLTQAIFPHLSLFHIPSNFCYSQYNSNLRFPPSPSEPIEKYFGHLVFDMNGLKAGNVHSDSTLSKEREMEKSKIDTRREAMNSTSRDKESNNDGQKNDSRPMSAFMNLSEIKNYPVAVHTPWMGNFCPVLPYSYPSWGFPFNQPIIPIYFPVSGKWQGNRNDDNLNSSPSNSPMGDSGSIQNEPEKKSDQKDENNTSEYDFEAFARELMLEQKSNYDEDEVDIEVNLEEIANSLKPSSINSGRAIDSEKFFNSKENLEDTNKENFQDKDEMQNWRLSSEINMQDCCIRTLSNENLWYEARDDKRSWDQVREISWKENSYTISKHNIKEGCNKNGNKDKDKIRDGLFHEANSSWNQDRCQTEESDLTTHLYWKKNSGRRFTVPFEESPEKASIRVDNKRDWTELSQTEISEEAEFSKDKINSLKNNSLLPELKDVNDQRCKLDIQYGCSEEQETISRGGRKMENKLNELTRPQSPACLNNKIKKDEKIKSFGFTTNRNESLKFPISSSRKSKKPEDTKKRWLT